MKKLVRVLALSIFFFPNIKAQTITTIAGNGTSGYSGDGGLATLALLKQPNQICFDQSGNLIIAEDNNHVIRKIASSGLISTIAGNGTMGYGGDGGLATNAQLNRATGVAVDAIGNIYICDGENYRIRKINTSGIISTIAGNGTLGYSGDGGPAINAEIGFTSGICVDAVGNIYFADQNGGYCIRKINTLGIISTFAGNGTSGFSGDGGPASSAQLVSPASIFLDGTGNFYIGDFGGMRVRKVNPLGIISTFAGNGSFGSGGDGGLATSAQLFYPYGITKDINGNVYICESGNNKIRKVINSGIISTYAGIGGLLGGYGGDGGLAINAQLYHPSAICTDIIGDIYIGDYENNAIRKITMNPTNIIDFSNSNKSNFLIYPNPNNGSFTLKVKDPGKYTLHNYLGETLEIIISTYENEEISILGLKQGVYMVQGNNEKQKLIVNN